MAEPPRLQRFIRKAELPHYVGLKKTQIEELIKTKQFPAPIPITDIGRAVAWLEDELIAWQADRIKKPRIKRPMMKKRES